MNEGNSIRLAQEKGLDVSKPLFIIDSKRIPVFFDAFNATLGVERGSQVEHLYHAKAGPVEIVKGIPQDVTVVSSADTLYEVLKTNDALGKGEKTMLHIGQPNEKDFHYISTPTPKQMEEILTTLGPDKERFTSQITEMIFDGKFPTSHKNFQSYFDELTRLFPKLEKVHLRISQNEIRKRAGVAIRHGADVKTTLETYRALKNAYGNYDFSFNLYFGNPITDAMLEDILVFIDELKDDKPTNITIGGFAGVGNHRMPSGLSVFRKQLLNKDIRLDIEHGTDLVERVMSVAFKGKLTEEAIKEIIPDARNQQVPPVFSYNDEIPGYTVVYTPTSYLHKQLNEQNHPYEVLYLEEQK